MPIERAPELQMKLLQAITQVSLWVEAHGYRAFDPGDGGKSFLRHFTFNDPLLERILTASVLRSPFEIRPWIGIQPHISSKGMGYIAWGYIKMFAATRQEAYRDRAEHCLQWLLENTAAGSGHYCWGNDFSFSTRAGTIPRSTPTIVWSSLIGLAFLEAFEVTKCQKYLQAAVSTADWILALPSELTREGICLSYVPDRQSSIHNSNMLGASLLAVVAKYTGDSKYGNVAREAMIYSCSRQNADGSWFYGEDSKYHWIDNFHTGYNLDALKRYEESIGSGEFSTNLQKGFLYYKRKFVEDSGRPKYYHDKALPIDIQCAAQSIDTLTNFSQNDNAALVLAQNVACWTIDHMQAPDGHFYYRDLGWKKIKTPMLHWGQGTMFKAISHLFARLSNRCEGDQGRRSAASSEPAAGIRR